MVSIDVIGIDAAISIQHVVLMLYTDAISMYQIDATHRYQAPVLVPI
jgi:hypothetical protein